MPSPKTSSLSFFCSFSVPLLLFFLVSTSTISAASEPFIYGGCSRQKYSPISSYQTNLDSLLASLATASTSGLYSHSSAGKPGDPDAVSGVVQCRGDLPGSDCLSCVQDAINQLRLLCFDATGAAIQLDSCFLKYDNATFVGVLDTTLIYKRCGPSSYDPSFAGQRDDALRQLSDGGGGGSYRTASSGTVYGVAQCVGDLSPGDCSRCVSQAVAKLKEACGSAISGDSFLGKCYARYSSSASSSSSFPSSGTYPHSNHDSYTGGDEAGKTLAIIIGLFAGVALLILFLTYLRKSCSNGKG
ncbi:Cysteine-rich repeat secretory protein 12 [Nymphaea thermarum]|nr:Cysteine-rich repeat secretory protein 12 [Nymphaea thermarum]